MEYRDVTHLVAKQSWLVCGVLAYRWKGKLYVCSFFFPRIRRLQLVFAGVGPPCVLTKFSVPSHTCFCVSILGSANDVLPLMVLVNVGCNTVEENNTYRPLCKVLWEC